MAAIGVAADEPAVDPQLQRQTVQQHRVALTDGGVFVQQGRVGCVFQRVFFIVEIAKVVCNGLADIVVDGLDLSVIAQTVQIELGQQSVYRGIHFRFLSGGGVIGNCNGNAVLICTIAERPIAAADGIASVLPP